MPLREVEYVGAGPVLGGATCSIGGHEKCRHWLGDVIRDREGPSLADPPEGYGDWLADLKGRIHAAQQRATFYHLKLRSDVLIELKSGSFKPEHLGQLGFYLTTVDAQVKAPEDNPTIGLLLCKSKNQVVAEYALRDTARPLGVAEYQLMESLPESLQTSLPTIEQIERELTGEV